MGKLPADLTGLDLNRLVEELAAGLRPPVDIWNENGIKDRATAAKLLGLPVVQQMLQEARARWHERGNLRERIKAKTLVGIEQNLADMFDDAMNPNTSLQHRVAMLKFLGSLAGIEAEAAGAVAAAGVSISIDLSGTGGSGPGGGEGAGDGIIVIEGGTTTRSETKETDVDDDDASVEDTADEGEVNPDEMQFDAELAELDLMLVEGVPE